VFRVVLDRVEGGYLAAQRSKIELTSSRRYQRM
jgi:hypothetical protein